MTTEPMNHTQPSAEPSAGAPQPPVMSAAPRTPFFRLSLTATSNAFVAEYSVMLIALTFALSNLVWLLYTFFGLIVAAMQGTGVDSSSLYVSTPLLVLWQAVLSAVSIPTAAILWSRTQGELADNPEYKGELPRGGARGFRSFWLVIAGLSILLTVAAAVYAPLDAAVSGSKVGETLLGVTLPALLSAFVIGAGIVMVTRPVHKRPLVRLMLWGVVALTVILVAADYLWASNMHTTEKPANPYTSPYVPAPSNPYSPSKNIYDDTYPTQ
jgi:hypothetical protein